MSCDWNIKCVTCDVVHGFDEANNEKQLMRDLIEHRHAFAAFHPVTISGCEVKLLTTWYGSIDTEWFVQHHDHELRPVNEYGVLDGECGRQVRCQECKTSHHCVLPHGHPESTPHSMRPPGA